MNEVDDQMTMKSLAFLVTQKDFTLYSLLEIDFTIPPFFSVTNVNLMVNQGVGIYNDILYERDFKIVKN